ncbi:lysylphosphatidylglycerol synthase transmembrane domain-containing protein [Hymenobacter edaphi]|uniref:TIGR00374 family protein n=1 Tax=Hymenobacter edaphi TaxID=2211146 RepID=A0A328BTN8_9BACT|nr:lysylphosphatidylglycerol synthase transmembrane domain-containing protein [Hymenobacter edaphi]RAK68398.1 TIGR00374 family protein [Hymenobacter edaphi]
MSTTQQDRQLLDKLSPSRMLLPVVIGLGVVGFMFWRSYQPGDLAALGNAKPGWLLITLLVLLVRDVGYMYRIRHIAEKQLSWKQSVDVIMIWEFASCLLPSAVGGTAIASLLLNKEGIPLGKSLAYIMVTAMLDNLYFVVAGPLVWLLAGDYIFPHETLGSGSLVTTLKVAFWVSYVFTMAYSGLMAYALFINPHSVKRFLVRLFSLKGLHRWRRRAYHHGLEMVHASAELRGNSFRYWAEAALSTAFVWTARYLVIGCLIAAFIDVSWGSFGTIFARNLVYKVVLLIAITPGGAGFAEGAFPMFFRSFAGSATVTNFILLLYRIVTYYLYLVLGTIFLPRWVGRVFGKQAVKEVMTS